MATIAFILLCHRDPEAVIRQARQLAAAGDRVAIHLDARAPRADHARLRTAFGADPLVRLVPRPLRCGWGDWSLVQATLNGLETALAAFPEATHFYLLSGDCGAIKTADYAHRQLDAAPLDHIESVDFFDAGWIRTGMTEERLIYRHPFNERRQPRLFGAALELQKRLRLRRGLPAGLRMMIGSQWWCLRRGSVEAVLGFIRQRRDVVRFFRHSWIPDESFFQTLVRHLVPDAEISSRSPTFLMFSDYGMPVSFHDDHYDLLLGQDALFARKIDPGASGLKARLGDLWASDCTGFEITGEGRELIGYLAGRGREGSRFTPRFWQAGGHVGPGRELVVVVGRKWHVAKRLLGSIKHHTGLPAVDFLFDEEATALPDLGGIESSLAKRNRHRRALLRLLFEAFDTDRLVICVDIARLELLRDLVADAVTLRILELDCRVEDSYLRAHAGRTGLAAAASAGTTLAQLLPAMRQDLRQHTDRLRAADLPGLRRLSETATPADNIAALAAVLSLPQDVARGIAETPNLFDD